MDRNEFVQELQNRFGLSEFDAKFTATFPKAITEDSIGASDELVEFVQAWWASKREPEPEPEPEPRSRINPARAAEEATRLRQALPSMRRELAEDPEGCFGGRGNNIGERIVADTEAHLRELEAAGYTEDVDLDAEPEVDTSMVRAVKFWSKRDHRIYIEVTREYGYKAYRHIHTSYCFYRSGNRYEAARTWENGQEPPDEVKVATLALTGYSDWDKFLSEYRGRVYNG